MTKYHRRFNTQPMAIQNPMDWSRGALTLLEQAHDVPEFEALLDHYSNKHLKTLRERFKDIGCDIIGDPAHFHDGDPKKWKAAVYVFRFQTFESLVEYFYTWEPPKRDEVDWEAWRAAGRPPLAPDEMPRTKPNGISRTMAHETPRMVPNETPSTMPNETSRTMPIETPRTMPIETPRTKGKCRVQKPRSQEPRRSSRLAAAEKSKAAHERDTSHTAASRSRASKQVKGITKAKTRTKR